MKAVVTGGCGQIGSYLVELLISKGFEVTVLDNLVNGSLDNLRMVEGKYSFEKVNLSKDILIFKEADVVFHLAAIADMCLDNPKVVYESNILATFNVLETMVRDKVKTIVFASSSHVYGEAVVPTVESYFTFPISVYGGTKVACEGLIRGYWGQKGLKGVIVRFSTVSSERQRYGVYLDFIKRLRKNPKALTIFGDGKQRRSYVHARNAAEALWSCYEYSRKNNSCDTFNVANYDTSTILTVAKEVVSSMGLQDVKFSFTGGRSWLGDIERSELSIKKITSMVGWKPNPDTSNEVVRMAAKGICERLGVLKT
jgi:UDP-glucose 4-epimerase